MDIVIFDPMAGASGDMINSCFVNAGADEEKIIDGMKSATEPIGDIEVSFKESEHNSISATRMYINSSDKESANYEEIVSAIENSTISKDECKTALKVFENLYMAESKIHGNNVHFHEVGRADAIADVVGASIAYHDLSLNKEDIKVVCTPISVGGGYTTSSHGKIPVPAPATSEILSSSDLLWQGGPINEELLTPTGAAIFSVIIDESRKSIPLIGCDSVSRGRGSLDLEIPNLLTMFSGTKRDRFVDDHISILEPNVDDVDGEILGGFIEQMMDAGALDVSVIPTITKKGRGGTIVKILSKQKDIEKLATLVVRELGTLGVRITTPQHRLIADRKITEVEVFGEMVDVKIGKLKDGEVIDISAEYDDCRRIGKNKGIPVNRVRRAAESKVEERIQK